MKEKVLISFSGGRTSAMMTYYLINKMKDKYDFTVVFANTGHERESTLQFIKRCDEYFKFNTIWVEAVTNHEFGKGVSSKVVNFETAYRNYKKNGVDPFEQVIAKHGITNMDCPNCSREMKGYTIRAYMRDFLGFKKKNYKLALGIRSDEPKRLDWVKAKKENILYLAELGNVNKYDVNKFWAGQPFDLEVKSYEGNCILCWKKSDRKLFTIIQEGIINNDIELLAEIEWIKTMQKKYGRYIPEHRRKKQDKGQTVNFFRDERTIEQMIDESYLLDPTEYANDESKLIETAKQIAMWDNSLDINSGCVESCEAF